MTCKSLQMIISSVQCTDVYWTWMNKRERLFSFVHLIDREKEWPSIVNLFVDSFHLRSERNKRWNISTIHSFLYFPIKVKQQNNKRIHWSNEENFPIGIDISPSSKQKTKQNNEFVRRDWISPSLFFLHSPVTMTC